MATPGIVELVVILFIIVLIFGSKKIPDLMAGLGEGIKNFKKGISDSEEEVDKNQIEVDKNQIEVDKNQIE
jgi:sec-independent protein translocase protein TatA